MAKNCNAVKRLSIAPKNVCVDSNTIKCLKIEIEEYLVVLYQYNVSGFDGEN
jgi:hypothetical protein